jgi:hypothetical protein
MQKGIQPTKQGFFFCAMRKAMTLKDFLPAGKLILKRITIKINYLNVFL